MTLPPIYCITLHQTPERRQLAWQHFGKIGLNVRPFYGIHGESFHIQSTYRHKVGGWKISHGHSGLVMTHYMLWRCLQEKDLNEVIILEDDAFFRKDFYETFCETYKQLPRGWHCVYLGWLDKHFPHREMKQVTDSLWTCKGGPIFGTHCMLLNRKGIDILEKTNRECRNHVDIQIWQNTCDKPNVNFNHYVCYPSMVKQRSVEGKNKEIWHTITNNYK